MIKHWYASIIFLRINGFSTYGELEEATSDVEVFEKGRKLGQGQVDFDGIRI